MEFILTFIYFIFSFRYSFEIIPNWNLDSSAVQLIPSSGVISYPILYRDMYGMRAKLTKVITLSDNKITQNNYLSVNDGTGFEVNFENIESFYHLNGIDIICPKGKYHPYDATNKGYFEPSNFEIKGDWDLKCYKHNTNYFLAFYLMNGEKLFFILYHNMMSKHFLGKVDHLLMVNYLILNWKMEKLVVGIPIK